MFPIRHCTPQFVCLWLSLLWPGQGFAETTDPAVKQQELGTVEQELETSTARQQALRDEIAAALATENQLADKLVSLGRSLQAQEAALAATQDKLMGFAKETIEIRSDLAAKQDVLSEILAGLQRLEQNPPPALVVAPDDVLKALRGAMMFGAVVPDLRKAADLLLAKLERLDQIRVSVDQEKARLAEGLASLAAAQKEVDTTLNQQKLTLQRQRQNLKQEKDRTAALASKATSLKQLLSDLADEKAKADQQRSQEARLREEEKQRQRMVLSQPSQRLSEAEGKLNYPTQGQILKVFGDDDGLGGKLQGLAIATRSKATVLSPIDGTVAFAGSFRSYGKLLILDAGDGYLVLLAGMTAISAELGQSIKAGLPLGEMGDGPSSVTLLGDSGQDNRPILYVEFRKSGNPIDSKAWWIGASKEASQ
jgi:murein hydrolase activator